MTTSKPMKIKFGPQEVDLNRINRICKVGSRLALVYFHTDHSILVRCSVEYPDGMTFSFPGTVEELKAIFTAC